MMVVASQGMLGSPKRPNPDLKRRAKAAESLRKVMEMGPLLLYECEIAAKISLYAEQADLSHKVLDQWQRLSPKDIQPDMYRAKVELQVQAYGKAIEAANRVLKQEPNNQDMLDLRKNAGQKLRDQAKILAPQ